MVEFSIGYFSGDKRRAVQSSRLRWGKYISKVFLQKTLSNVDTACMFKFIDLHPAHLKIIVLISLKNL